MMEGSTVKPRLSFANVTSMLALFIALGGTSYAAATLSSNSVNKSHLRSNSVGKSEIRRAAVGQSEVRANSIGASELRTSAVGSNDVKDETLGVNDLAPAARTALADINGVTFRASSTAAGARTAGNVASIAHTGTGVYTVETGRDVSACQYSATVAGVKSGTTIDPAQVGFATAEPVNGAPTQVTVKTYDALATPIALADRSFSLLIAC
jgi:hypothetical protein